MSWTLLEAPGTTDAWRGRTLRPRLLSVKPLCSCKQNYEGALLTMGSRQPAPCPDWLAIRSPENSVNSLPVIWMLHTKSICCLFVSCGRLVTVFKEVVSETLPERTSRSVIFKTLTMPRTPWKAFLPSGFSEQ